MELQYLFKDTRIQTIIDKKDEPWFIGKEIATVLGYKITEKAIRTHVDEEDRELLENLRPSILDGRGYQKHAICINESGLYSLILKSKLKEAKMFKRWVTKEVLPSIRKKGEFRMKEQLSAEFEKKMAIMDSQIDEIKKQVTEKDLQVTLKEKELEEERTLRLEEFRLRLEKEKELEREIEQKQLLEKHLSRYQKIEKDDIIYVLTNHNDLKNNVFKVGKTTKKNYKNRLSQYNTGSSVENYYVFMSECFDAKLVEKTFSFYLEKYKLKVAYDEKEKTNDEMYKMNIEDLLYVLKKILGNHGEIGEYVNKNHETIFRKSVSVGSKVQKVSEYIKEKKFGGPVKGIVSQEVDESDINYDEWLFSLLEKNDKGFVGLLVLKKLFRRSFPNDETTKNKKDLDRLINSLFNNKGVYLKEQYQFREEGKKIYKRNVFIGFKFKRIP